jgi:gas vesicle protein
MADTSTVFGGAAGGASTGAAIGSFIPIPGVGTAIGAVVGGIAGLFSTSPEEERKNRYNELVSRLRELRDTGLQKLNQMRNSRLAQNAQSGARRAAAGGMTSEAESFILPGQENIETSMSNATGNVVSDYENRLANVDTDFANRPIEPNVSDYLMQFGKTGIEMSMNDKYIEALKSARQPATPFVADKVPMMF